MLNKTRLVDSCFHQPVVAIQTPVGSNQLEKHWLFAVFCFPGQGFKRGKDLVEIGFSMGMVQDTADLDRCPHLEARNMFVESGDALGGRFRTVNTPIKLTACVDTPAGTPPLLGQHNREILCGIGGLTPEELAAMEQDGVS